MKHKNGKILTVLFFGVLMGALDISIVGPALPSIELSIRVEHRMLSWIFSIYVLFNLVGVSFLAKLSDLFGRRIIYVLSVFIFGVGSAVVAYADNMTLLLAGRAIQGFGASGIFPVATAVIGDVFPPEKRGRAIGSIGAIFGIAFLVGPVIAGVMLMYFSWNSLFLINLPIAAAIMYFAWKLLPSQRAEKIPHFDWVGMALIAILLASFAYGINSIDVKSGLAGLVSVSVLPFLIVTLVALAAFIYVELRSPEPVVKIKLFDVRQIRIVGLVAVGAGFIQSVTVFVPEMAVEIYKVTFSKASFMLVPFVIAIGIGSPVSGRLLDKVGSRWIVIAGLLFSSLGLLLMILSQKSMLYFYTGGILMGLGSSMLQGSSMRYIMLNEVKPSERALGQGLITLFVSVGQMTGATLFGMVVAAKAVRADGYPSAFLIIAVLCLLISVVSLQLKSRAKELATAK